MTEPSTSPVPCDLAVFVAHPDDAELNCGGTLAMASRLGYRTAVVDLTRGELSTRGTVDTREKETMEASRTLGLTCRLNLSLRDGHLHDSDEARAAVVQVIRQLRPSVIVAPPDNDDHHADHIAAGQILARSYYLAGVKKYAAGLEPWRPNTLLHYVGSRRTPPEIVVDVSEDWETRVRAALCYRSQFDPDASETPTRIALPEFMEWIEARHRYHGFLIGVSHGEAYTSPDPVPVTDPVALFGRGKWENR